MLALNMPKASFFQLPLAKQTHILQAAQALFATIPYAQASTNVLVKACGISKGSLFNYFEDKAELYLYTLQQAHQTLAEAFHKETGFSEDLLERFLQWTRLSMQVWKSHPQCYGLFMQFRQAPEALQQRYLQDYAPPVGDFFREAFADIDPQALQYPLETCLKVLEWALTGIKQEAEARWRADMAPEQLEKEVLAHTRQLCDILRHGFFAKASPSVK